MSGTIKCCNELYHILAREEDDSFQTRSDEIFILRSRWNWLVWLWRQSSNFLVENKVCFNLISKLIMINCSLWCDVFLFSWDTSLNLYRQTYVYNSTEETNIILQIMFGILCQKFAKMLTPNIKVLYWQDAMKNAWNFSIAQTLIKNCLLKPTILYITLVNLILQQNVWFMEVWITIYTLNLSLSLYLYKFYS